MCGVLEFSGSKQNSVLPPKPLTGSVSVNRVDDDAISIAVPSTDSQNSNSNETGIVKWKRRLIDIRFIHYPTSIYQRTLY